MPICFALDDLAYYGRWFWASHVIHHSSQHHNLSTAPRQTWTAFVSTAFLFRLPLFLLGFPPAMAFFVAGLNVVHKFWIRTEAVVAWDARHVPGLRATPGYLWMPPGWSHDGSRETIRAKKGRAGVLARGVLIERKAR